MRAYNSHSDVLPTCGLRRERERHKKGVCVYPHCCTVDCVMLPTSLLVATNHSYDQSQLPLACQNNFELKFDLCMSTQM